MTRRHEHMNTGDFVTRSHYCALEDGTLVIANCAEEHDMAPTSDEYISERSFSVVSATCHHQSSFVHHLLRTHAHTLARGGSGSEGMRGCARALFCSSYARVQTIARLAVYMQ